jgi:hypothetical protein
MGMALYVASCSIFANPVLFAAAYLFTGRSGLPVSMFPADTMVGAVITTADTVVFTVAAVLSNLGFANGLSV